MRFFGRILLLALLCAGWASVSVARGDHIRYRWRDGQGNLHFDDSLPDRALQYGYDVISPSGRVVRHVHRKMTDAELKAHREAIAEQRRRKEAAHEQAQYDRQMLAAYPEESDLKREQTSRLAMLDQNIRAARISLANQEKSLTVMLTRAADLERAGNHVPSDLTSQINTVRANIEHQKAYIAGKQEEKVESEKQFALKLAHYRKLKAEQPH